ncbi:MAG: phenylalanine--tRNA ligase subunit alpha [Candidatus Buchananbacteria bacterium]
MKDQLTKLLALAKQEISQASDLAAITQLEIKYLGRAQGELTAILRQLKTVAEADRPMVGQLANQVKLELEQALNTKKQELTTGDLAGNLAKDWLDVTSPGLTKAVGHLHPITQAINEIVEIMGQLGFYRVRYPEVEWDYYAFSSLNMPADHPARDEWETFFIDKEPVGELGQRLLTPHTSSGQVREMEKGRLPIRMLNVAKCYRRQMDVSHLVMFHQFEGLLVDKNVSIAEIKGTFDFFVKKFFGPDRTIRLRPHHFRFTEPSFEIDVSCGLCGGTGKLSQGEDCRVCKMGWLELGGAGMVHPNVLKAGKIDPKVYQGFAFGWGVERTYMMKAGVKLDDIRLIYQNDLRFLEQF